MGSLRQAEFCEQAGKLWSAGAAGGARPQSLTQSRDGNGATALDCGADGVDPDIQTGANHWPRIGGIGTGPPGQRLGGIGGQQTCGDMVARQSHRLRSNEQRGEQPSLGVKCHPGKAARGIDHGCDSDE